MCIANVFCSKEILSKKANLVKENFDSEELFKAGKIMI
jgi:hypothetical protein